MSDPPDIEVEVISIVELPPDDSQLRTWRGIVDLAAVFAVVLGLLALVLWGQLWPVWHGAALCAALTVLLVLTVDRRSP